MKMGEKGITTSSILYIIKLMGIRPVRHEACMGKEEKLTKFQSKNLEKRPHGETQVEMEEYIKLYIKETLQGSTSWMELTWLTDNCTDLANVLLNLGVADNMGKFLIG